MDRPTHGRYGHGHGQAVANAGARNAVGENVLRSLIFAPPHPGPSLPRTRHLLRGVGPKRQDRRRLSFFSTGCKTGGLTPRRSPSEGLLLDWHSTKKPLLF